MRYLMTVLFALAFTLPQAANAESGVCTHNGSTMNVSVHAGGGPTKVLITYIRPRRTIADQGAYDGTEFFRGTMARGRDQTITGNAHIFSAKCGAIPYRVSGEMNRAGTLLTLSGDAPVLDDNCRVRSYRDNSNAELVFSCPDGIQVD